MGISQSDKEVLLKIEEAMKNHELKAYYQPQYDAMTSRLASAEALVRWVKPDGSIVPPLDFIPVLEKTEAVMDVDWYMLREVCDFLVRLEKENKPRVKISVNFSRVHFKYENNFTEKLCSIVDSYGVPHNLIEVEITESAFLSQSKAIERTVKEIRKAGFTTAIDDFGSGASSLSFVKDVDTDILKIDRPLISHNCEDEKERTVLESIFHFAHRLKLTTVAEGVETKEQLGFLRTCGCKLIQGFLFSKPLPEAEFVKACETQIKQGESDDILITQSHLSADQLLIDAIFVKYTMVIFINLTRNSYYMMTYDNFTTTTASSTGIFDELIEDGTKTMHEDDKKAFHDTFCRENQLKCHAEGKKTISLITHQLGDDGIYRKVETYNVFVSNPSSTDVLAISFNGAVAD